MTRTEYEYLKHTYHVTGQRARGKLPGSDEQLAYEKAKREFHRAGEELRRIENDIRASRK